MKLKEIPSVSFTLGFSPKHNLLHLKGPLEIGVVAVLERLLLEHPDANGIILDSEGGNIYQGRGLAKNILNHSLDTYSIEACYSACTLAYIAGTRRYLGTSAKLGFHNYRIESKLMEPLIDIEQERRKDLAFFRKQMIDPVFIRKISELRECPDLWIPNNSELLEAGVVHEIFGKDQVFRID